MGHHINSKNEFQSDKYPDLAPDKIILSFKDKAAKFALWRYVEVVRGQGSLGDTELADDIAARLISINEES